MISNGFTGPLLDRYLANGWYRMGVRMFSCRYSFQPWGFLSTVWTRLPLDGHAFPRSVAKLLRRNARRYRHEVHPARATAAEETVFARYAACKAYDLQESAAAYLVCDPQAPFDTWQVSVFDRDSDELVAFSYFDRGARSLQSIGGYYDPARERDSLGLYTLALEVAWAKERGMAHHYAGYIVPGNEVFEYKRRVGPLECYDDVRRRWYPIDELDRDQLPDAIQRQALEAYHDLYTGLDEPFSVRLRPQYFIGISQRDLQWVRREQLPFAVTDVRANRRPFWACHLYSFNFRRYFSLLCTSHAYELESVSMPRSLMQRPDPMKRYEHVGSGVSVSLLHYRNRPYELEDLQRVWWAVERANERARG